MSLGDLDRASLPQFQDYIRRLSPDTPRRWGRLTPHALLRHLRYVLEVSLGQAEGVQDQSIPVVRDAVRVLFFEWFTRWPRGKVKAPVEWTPEPGESFEEERDALLGKMAEFVEALERDRERRTISPLLGPTSLAYWSHIQGLHFAHHFRQFGLMD